jgi:small subunit ribosomal protein S7
VEKENVRKQEAGPVEPKAAASAAPAAPAPGPKTPASAPAQASRSAAPPPAAVAEPRPAGAPGAAPAAAAERKVTGVGIKPDVRYGQVFVSKFINCLMKRGKKSKAEHIFYSAMDILAKKYPSEQPLKIFETALNNVKPLVEVKSKRVGGATYQVPFEVNRKRQQSLSIRWVLEGARKRKGKSMEEKLALELVDAYNKTGAAWTMRENTHKMAEANKAFAHFAW